MEEQYDISKDCLTIAIQDDLDKVVTDEICGAVYETAHMDPYNETPSEVLDKECKTRKNAVVNVFLSCVRLQRLYFIIRSAFTGIITGLLTYAIISVFSITDFFLLVLIGLFSFIVSLAISRVFDQPVISLSNIALHYLSKHRRLMAFVLSRL